MSYSDSSASSSSGLEELTSPRPVRRRHGSSGEASDYHRDDTQRGQPSTDHADHMRPTAHRESGFSQHPRLANEEEHSWPAFLRDHNSSMDASRAEQHRPGHSNVDRKRRLTNLAHPSGRVRSVSGGFHSRNQGSQGSVRDGPSSAGLPQAQRYNPTLHNSARASHSESSLPVLPNLRRQSSDTRRPMSSAREVILPKWQPDSEVSECPICLRQFTFWFRKHHCRKCGRVVCASCSPHRITIPRQFIVHPPESTNTTSTSTSNNPIVIDLTGEAESSPTTDMPPSENGPMRTSNPGLGGGEVVRLCNPCVPDPQPSLQATMDLAEFLRQCPGRSEVGNPLDRGRNSRMQQVGPQGPGLHDQHLPPNEARELRRQRGRGMIFQPDNHNLNTIQTTAHEIPDESLPAYGNFSYTLVPNYTGRDRPPGYHFNSSPAFSPPGYSSPRGNALSVQNRGLPQPGSPSNGVLPSHLHRSSLSHLPAHGRYSSMDTMTRPTPSAGNRPRVRSMLDTDPRFRHFIDQASSSPSSRPLPSPRPRLHENDICPVCRCALPPKGENDDETAREAHIMDCIAAREPSAQSSTSARRRSMAQSPPSAPLRMLLFTASEKDCVGEDGSTQECSICFVEYDVGDHLARLECLCKFHKTCIMEWFSRKQECPVHKVA